MPFFPLVHLTASVVTPVCLKHLPLAGQWTNQNPQGLCKKQPLIPNPDLWFTTLRMDWPFAGHLTGICIPPTLYINRLVVRTLLPCGFKRKGQKQTSNKTTSNKSYTASVSADVVKPSIQSYPNTRWADRASVPSGGRFPSSLQKSAFRLQFWRYSKWNHPH